MQTYIALFRGINVSGQKKIKMADLRQHLENLGFQHVKTYIQSGNVIFQFEESAPKDLEQQIAKKIQAEYGFDVSIFITNASILKEILENNPFLERGEDVKKLYVTFLDQQPSQEKIDLLQSVDYSPEEYILRDLYIYFFFPNGYGRAKLNNNFFERKLKVTATTRNWKTVNKLYELAYNE